MYFAVIFPAVKFGAFNNNSKLYEIDVDSGVASFITRLTYIPTTIYKNLSSGNLTYYYTLGCSYNTPCTLYSVTNNVVTVVDTQFKAKAFSIDSTGKYLYFIPYISGTTTNSMYQYKISNGANTTLDGTSTGDFPVSSSTYCGSTPVSPNGGSYSSFAGLNPVVISTGVLFTAWCGSSYSLKFAAYNVSSNTTDYLTYGWQNTAAGFFQCEAETLDVLPSKTNIDNVLGSFCPNNGIVWSTTLSSPLYFFPSYAEAYVQSPAAEQCPASLDSICTTVGALPPYICSKKIYSPFFATLSTALANTQTLLTILFLVFGFLLPKISGWFGIPVPKQPDEPSKKAGAVEMGAISPVHAVSEDVNVK